METRFERMPMTAVSLILPLSPAFSRVSGEEAVAGQRWVHLYAATADRVEVAGLRPPPLPHHRTCGFPHTAVESSNLLSGTSRRRIASNFAPRGSLRLHRFSFSAFGGVVAAVAAPRSFLSSLGSFSRLFLQFVDSSALGSSPLSRSLSATMAFADFSRALTREISPGRGLNFPRTPPDST